MSIVLWHTVVSLDGFIARPNDEMSWIFDFDLDNDPTIDQVVDSTGALLVGRRTQDVEDRDQPGFYGGAFRGPFFVLRHDPPSTRPIVKGVEGTYLDTDISSAMSIAREAAAGKNVGLLGASIARQCLRAGLVDEILVHVAPILLGDGIRLFDERDVAPITLRPLSVARAGDFTALRFALAQ